MVSADPPDDLDDLDDVDDLPGYGSVHGRWVGLAIGAVIAFGDPLRHIADDGRPVAGVVLLGLGTAVLLAFWALIMGRYRAELRQHPPPWPLLSVFVACGWAMTIGGGTPWNGAAAIVAIMLGFDTNRRRALVLVLATSAVVASVAAREHHSLQATALQAAIPVGLGYLTYGFSRRGQLALQLQMTRRELARVAVAEERLRIARDLHDVVGHNLSVIAMKAELARRVLPTDESRAGEELTDIEAVARRSLSETRQVVTGYRRPTLAAELVSVRRSLASAGIDCRVLAPETWDLPGQVDEALAWTAREAATNVLRHSRARHCTVRLTEDDRQARLEVVDDGVGSPPDGSGGHGLAGVAERVTRLGGELDAGSADGRGFRLRVAVPRLAP